MPSDDLDHIPAIVPTRDGDHPRAGATRTGGNNRAPGKAKPAPAAGGTGTMARLVITIALVVAAVACAWAWQLQQQLEQAGADMRGNAERIADLEARLSDTDEGMNQSATLQAAKIRELDSEVRKLWDNVWKQARERLESLEQAGASQGRKLATAEKSLAAAQAQLKGAAADIASLKVVAGELQGLMASARTNQAEVERVADALNRINLDIAKLNKRVQGNEDWIGSINSFRKQVNANLVDLQAAVRLLQATP